MELKSNSPVNTYSPAHAVMNKAFVWSIFLVFNFMVTFRVLLASFVSDIEGLLEAGYELFLVLYVVYRIIVKAIAGNLRANSLEIYMGMLFFLPIIPAIGAYFTFGQPLFYGLVVFRDSYLVFGALLVYDLWRKGEISIDLIERAFVFSAWLTLFVYYGSTLFTNPSDFQGTGLAGSNTEKGDTTYYKFNMAYMFFGAIYYFVKSFYRRKPMLLLYSALFLIYVVFIRLDRTSMAVVLGAMAAFFFTALNIRRQVLWLGIAALLFTTLGFGAYFFFPSEVQQYTVMFQDALALAGVSPPPDGEESIRTYEMNIALEYIAKSPIIGNGKVSNEWVEGGYDHFLGFFYPSDVGIPGQLFMYGFFGGAILYGQFALAAFYISRIKHIKKNVFLVSLKFFLLALALDALTNGYITMYAAQTITALVLIYCFYQKDKILAHRILNDSGASNAT